MVDIHASVVLYGTNPVLLESLVKAFMEDRHRLSLRLHIVDNSPHPVKVPEWILENEACKYVHVGRNLGYGGAHNLAMREAAGDSRYLLILNPDIRFEPGTLPALYDFMQKNQDVVECMPDVLYPDGERQYLCKLLPTPIDLFARRFIPGERLQEFFAQKYELRFTGYDKPMNVPSLSGCFMMLRSSVVMQHDLYFDERYFMYLEDFDLVRRCHRVGRTMFYPGVSIVHDHQKASYRDLHSLGIHLKSALKYFNKYGWFLDSERRKINRKTIAELTSRLPISL